MELPEPSDLVLGFFLEGRVPRAEFVGQAPDSPDIAHKVDLDCSSNVLGGDPEVSHLPVGRGADLIVEEVEEDREAVVCELDASVRVREGVGRFYVAE